MMKKRLAAIFAALAIGLFGYLKGTFDADIRQESFSYAANALKKTGLPEEYAPGFCLHGFAGFRDTFLLVKFVVESGYDRDILLEHTASVDGWRAAPVGADEYLDFQRLCMWTYAEVLNVPAGIVFDAWYYHETSEPYEYSKRISDGPMAEIGQIGRGFEFAVYDAETGLFIFVDQFG